LLVSMRDTWAAYLVDIATGRIEWTLGGRRSSFTLGPNADFEWQHDVRLAPNGQLTLFDDHCCQLTGGGTYVSPTGPSRGLVLNLDQKTHTATLAAQYGEGYDLPVDYMGSTQTLANGNVFVGWGAEPYFTEFTPAGKVVLEGVLPGADLSYRALVEPWTGLPLTPPAAAARTTAGSTKVYASWNGATRVASWRVLAGSSTGPLTRVASAPRSGFETAISLPGAYARYEVEALDAGGHVIGTSREFS